jgi:hypothetical protein
MNVAADISADRGALAARLLRRPGWLTPADMCVLRIWLLSRCAVLVLTWPGVSVLQGSAKASRPWLSLWQNWDAVRLQAIAQYGYFGPAGHALPNQAAFFPGFPVVLAAVHLIVRQWTVSGLLVSFVAGGVAVVALSRLTDRDYHPGCGSKAALFLVASPAAIFLAAGYAEALFLAAALCGWLAARNGRRTLAVMLAGLACVIKVDGLFVCAALAAEILRTGHGRRVRSLAAFVPALIPLAAFALYLWLRTGDWLAWQHAELAGWQRRFTNPVTTFKTTWTAGFSREFAAPVSFAFQLEILAVLIGVAAMIALLRYRRWPEAVYVGLSITALATSVWYESVPRALLLLWPAWCGLAAAAARRAWLSQLYLAVSIPVSVSIGLLFVSGNWAG